MHKLLLHSKTFYLCKWQGDYPTLHPSALPDCIHISRPWGLKGGGRWTIRNEKHQCHSWPTLRYHSHMGVLGSSVKTVRNARVMQHQSRKHQSSCKTSSKHSRFLDVFIIICNFFRDFQFWTKRWTENTSVGWMTIVTTNFQIDFCLFLPVGNWASGTDDLEKHHNSVPGSLFLSSVITLCSWINIFTSFCFER